MYAVNLLSLLYNTTPPPQKPNAGSPAPTDLLVWWSLGIRHTTLLQALVLVQHFKPSVETY